MPRLLARASGMAARHGAPAKPTGSSGSHPDLGDMRPGRDLASAAATPQARHGINDFSPLTEPPFVGDTRSAPSPVAQTSHAAARRPRPRRGNGLMIGWSLVMACAVVVIVVLNLPSHLQDRLRMAADRTAVAAGFGVSEIAVIGHEQTALADILASLEPSRPRSLLAWDRKEVHARLAHLPWIESVRVVHVLPTTLTLDVVERRPFAIWQSQGALRLIDERGHPLTKLDKAGKLPALPIVVGRGAGIAAKPLLSEIETSPRIAKAVTAAVRVADRRWNLQLDGGVKILLPERGVRSALATLEALLATSSLTPDRVALVDLRIPERPTLRLTPGAAKARNRRITAARATAARAGGAS
ncbi:MAG: cell division protein FtsQ/DivIB [Pseudomonadota bacterium]